MSWISVVVCGVGIYMGLLFFLWCLLKMSD